MCDYSLVALRTRLAVDREELVTYRFPTGSLGLTAPAELELYRPEPHAWWSSHDASKVACAVCIPHGSRLRLRDIPDRLQQQLGVGAEEEVVFIQMSAEAGRHRDGVRFKNSQEILLQRLAEGQHAHVVSLLSGSSAEEEVEEVVVPANSGLTASRFHAVSTRVNPNAQAGIQTFAIGRSIRCEPL